MIHLEGREASKAVKSCDTCKHNEAFGCPSFIHDRCVNYSEWEQADGELTTALCSLPKIISEDGQDYVQLYDVLETIRRYMPNVAIPTSPCDLCAFGEDMNCPPCYASSRD